jgi:dTDP-4-amino-4,6-dideoxygalactose transaminase
VLRSETVRRDDLVLHLETRGIETRYLLPITNQPVYRHLFVDAERRFPVATRLNRDAFYVGCHPEMSDHDMQRVTAAFHDFFERYP